MTALDLPAGESMPYTSYEHAGRQRFGRVDGGRLVPLAGLSELGRDTDIDTLLSVEERPAEAVNIDDVRLRPVVPDPAKVVSVGTARPRGAHSDGSVPPTHVRLRTTDPEAAEREAARLLSPHRLRYYGERSEFDARVDKADLGPVSLLDMRFGTEISIERAARGAHMAILLPVTGTFSARHRRAEFTCTPQGAMAVLSPGRPSTCDGAATARCCRCGSPPTPCTPACVGSGTTPTRAA
jgi:hypothetical protein